MESTENNINSLKTNEITIGIIKGMIGIIPSFGTFINEIIFDISGRIQQKRINEFVKQLSIQIEKIKDNKVDNDYFKSDEFYVKQQVICLMREK